MAPIMHSIEIARSPEDVFAYVTDGSKATEWQANLVSMKVVGGGSMAVGAHVEMVRKIGGSDRTMLTEVTDYDPPRTFGFRGIDGPVRPTGKGTVEAAGDGARFTMALDFEGHGIGKVLVPLVVRRQAPSDLEKSLGKAKALLEAHQPAESS